MREEFFFDVALLWAVILYSKKNLLLLCSIIVYCASSTYCALYHSYSIDFGLWQKLYKNDCGNAFESV
jgi:hypothetical protein